MLAGKKTYLTALTAVVGIWSTYYSGAMDNLSLADAIQTTVIAILGATLRHGMAKEAREIAPALLLPLLLAVGGCATSPNGFPKSDPRHDYDWAQTSYNSTVQNLLILKRGGEISQADWDNAVYPLIVEGDRILDLVEAAALADNATVLDTRVTAFRAIYAKLIAWALVGEQGASDAGDNAHGNITYGSGLGGPANGVRGPGLGGQDAQPRKPGAGQAAPQGPGGGSWSGGVAA